MAAKDEAQASEAQKREAEKPQAEQTSSSEQQENSSERVAGDLGVPMLPGNPDEPVGPEDALGEGQKRGDYRERLGEASYQPHRGVEPQRPNADEIGDEEAKKGGVDTQKG